jgi:rRNA maturation endonuclease Nob1
VKIQAQALVEKLFRAKEDLKAIKDALKDYKISSEKLEELKKSRKVYSQQISDEKMKIEEKMNKDKAYLELREKTLDQEEKIAVSKQDLRVLLRAEALEKGMVEMEFDVNGQPVKLQSQAKVALYFNGREEK